MGEFLHHSYLTLIQSTLLQSTLVYYFAIANESLHLQRQYQPNAVSFNGAGISDHPVCWIGTESGEPDVEGIWSTGGGPDEDPNGQGGTGDPDSDLFCPKAVDTVIQGRGSWFFEPGLELRPISELVDVYHKSVGHNGVLELDFSPNRDGLIDPTHAAFYKKFGNWIKSCYGEDNVVAKTAGSRGQTEITLDMSDSSESVDRLVLREDITQGIAIRSFEIYVDDADTPMYSTDSGIGNKKIVLFDKPLRLSSLTVKITKNMDANFGGVALTTVGMEGCVAPE